MHKKTKWCKTPFQEMRFNSGTLFSAFIVHLTNAQRSVIGFWPGPWYDLYYCSYSVMQHGKYQLFSLYTFYIFQLQLYFILVP